jgi:hypothetical protein
MSARSLDLNGKMSQGNIKVIRFPDMNILDVKLHYNLIVSITGNQVTLSSCGWRTPTTKVAINNCLAQLGFSEKISQKKGIWYIGDQVFFDGYTIRSNK